MDATTPVFDTVRSERLPTYYGQPAVKPSPYRWTVASYIYIGGLAAGLQILVTAAELADVPGNADVLLIGRGVALLGAISGGILLILDLHTKRRFYNMLRIFRSTSPMSIGTYVLISFGFWSLLAFIVQIAGFSLVALVCGCIAAIAGWWMTTYTAALLAATATPLWASTPRLLAVRFASSSMATGAATACLIALANGANTNLIHAFGSFAALALIVELLGTFASAVIRTHKGLNRPLQEMPWGPIEIIGNGCLGILAPMGLYVLANFQSDHIWPLAASTCVLVGGFVMRAAILFAGNKSARRPEDYLRFAGGLNYG